MIKTFFVFFCHIFHDLPGPLPFTRGHCAPAVHTQITDPSPATIGIKAREKDFSDLRHFTFPLTDPGGGRSYFESVIAFCRRRIAPCSRAACHRAASLSKSLLALSTPKVKVNKKNQPPSGLSRVCFLFSLFTSTLKQSHHRFGFADERSFFFLISDITITGIRSIICFGPDQKPYSVALNYAFHYLCLFCDVKS